MGNDIAPILVTGAAGYLGRHVVDNLKRRGVSCLASTRNDCNLTDFSEVERFLSHIKPSVIIHCAAVVPKSASVYNDTQAVESSLAMINAIIQNAVCPIIFASSMTVYDEVKVFPVSEDNETAPKSAYACGKAMAEKALFERQFMGDVALRLPGLFGLPRRSGLLYNAAKELLSNRSFEISLPSGFWAAIAVQDAAEYMVRAAITTAPSRAPEAINVGYEGEFDVSSAVGEIALLCGVDWEKPMEHELLFSMRLGRLEERCGLLSVTFGERIEALVSDVLHDLQAGKAGVSNA